jgi:hypothetical protein
MAVDPVAEVLAHQAVTVQARSPIPMNGLLGREAVCSGLIPAEEGDVGEPTSRGSGHPVRERREVDGGPRTAASARPPGEDRI